MDFAKIAEFWQMIWSYLYKIIYKLTDGKYGYEDGEYVEGATFEAP